MHTLTISVVTTVIVLLFSCDKVFTCKSAPVPVCQDGYLECQNGRCFQVSQLCDGNNDCGDMTDEPPSCPRRSSSESASAGKPTSRSCGLGHTRCNNGKCIRAKYFCDGDDNCGDMSDEPSSCPTRSSSQSTLPQAQVCSHGFFQCGNGTCIEASFVCDGDNDCGDMTDERSCTSSSSGSSSESLSAEAQANALFFGRGHTRCNNGTCVEDATVET